MNFKKEWTKEDFSQVQKQIRKHFAGKTFKVHDGQGTREVKFPGRFKEIDWILGLAYTSSSSYAMFGVCNVEATYKTSEYKYSHFAMTERGQVVAVLTDKWEGEIFLSLPDLHGPVKTIDVNAKEWFDKVNGNSYFAAVVTVNFGMKDERQYFAPFQYGYGDQYRHEAFAILARTGEIPAQRFSYWQSMRDAGIITRYNKQENCKKSDVILWGKKGI